MLILFIVFGLLTAIYIVYFTRPPQNISYVNETTVNVSNFINQTIVAEGEAGVVVEEVLAEGKIIIKNELVRDSLLPNNDTSSPQLSYMQYLGHQSLPAPENVWRMGVIAGFFKPLLPGINPGDGGQGNIGGITWAIPAPGEYTINANCELNPSQRVVGHHQSFVLALNFGATTVDPTLSGYIPPGGTSSIDISSSSTLQPTVPLQLSLSANIHANCTNCQVSVGDELSLHMIQNHMGGPPNITSWSTCNIYISRIK